MKFPIFTWLIDLTGNIKATANVAVDNISLTTTDIWGYATETNAKASTDSLAYHLASTIGAAHADLTSLSTTAYEIDGDEGGAVLPNPKWTAVAGTTLTLETAGSSPLDLTSIGILGGSASVAVSGGEFDRVLESNPDGVWSPGMSLTDQLRQTHHNYADAGSPYDKDTDETVYLGEVQRVRFVYEVIEDAFVYAHRASDSDYATLADRDAADAYNVIDRAGGLLEQFCKGADIRVYFGHGDYITIRKDPGGRVTSVGDWITSHPQDNRRSSANLRGFKIVTGT